MDNNILNEKIKKVVEKIAKKENTIVKKRIQIEKKCATLFKMGIEDAINADVFDHKNNNEAYWLLCDIRYLKEDIARGEKEIEETKATLNKYQLQLEKEIEKESLFINEIPEILLKLQNELVVVWNKFDMGLKKQMVTDYKNMDREEYYKKYKKSMLSLKDKSDKEINKNNLADSKVLILNLYNRVNEITGEITSWDDIALTQGAGGCAVLNGFVTGKEGEVEIESILAGGYNIQKLHIRVLVKEVR